MELHAIQRQPMKWSWFIVPATIPKDNLQNPKSTTRASKLIVEVWTVLGSYSKNRCQKMYRLVPKAQPNSPGKCTRKYEPGNGDGGTQLCKPLPKNGNGTPAQERQLTKVGGQNGNIKCSETQVLNKTQEKTIRFSTPPTICSLHEIVRLPFKISKKFSPLEIVWFLRWMDFPTSIECCKGA